MDMLNSFNKEKTTYHTFTSTHTYLSDMGLSQFTTGVLYEWWNKKQDGVFINRKTVGSTDVDSHPEPLILQPNSQFLKANNLTFKSWRKEGKGGVYKHYAIPFSPVNGHSNDSAASNLQGDCEDIIPWSISVKVETENHGSDLSVRDYTFEDLDLHYYDNMAIDPKTGIQTPISGVYPITNIVALNDQYVYIGKDINYAAGSYIPNTYFLNDIKSSKYASLSFFNLVNFSIDLAGGNFSCIKPDVVEYKLRLFDYQAPKRTGKAMSLPGIVLATDSVLSHGQVALNQEDGDGDMPLDPDSPGSKAAGELDVSYKPATGKFTSGTEQILAMISVEVPKCEFSAGAEELKNMDISKILSNPSADEYFGIGSGLAIPINIQNGNPLQWAPSYSKPRGIRGTDLSKIEVTVYNPTPRTFSVNELVFLNKIDGVWVPLPIASGEGPSATPGRISDWDFTYHMTNGNFFFRGGGVDNLGNIIDPHQEQRPSFGKIKPSEMEEYFHQRYYKDDQNNKEPDGTYKGNLAFCNDGYFQVTSFDFMGPKVGGLREYDALKSTIWNSFTDGSEIDDPYDSLAKHTAPFFGCVFPDGYSSSKIPTYKTENSQFSAFPTGSPLTDLIDAKQYMKESHSLEGGPFEPEMLPEDFSQRPYEDGLYDNSRTDNVFGKGRSMFEEDDEVLRHLPADIAMNASPSGENGRPLTILGKLHTYITKFGDFNNGYYVEGESLQNRAHKYWQDHEVWLHPSGKLYDSTYDFAPRISNTIQFRPLIDAVYASMELGLAKEHAVENRNTVGWLGSRAWQQHAYDRSPIQAGAYIRESVYANDLFGIGQYAPQYNYMIDLNRSPELSAITSKTYFNKDYWGNRDWTHPIGGGSFDGAKPAFGFGVIGAICTASASEYINFSTTNYFGAPHYADIAISSDRLPSFGGSTGRDFDETQTTCLSARIYQSWPRDQTIYDPRFFAVHHFNPGTQLSGILEPWDEDYELQETETKAVTYEGSIIDLEVDVEMTDVDLRRPSIVENGEIVPITSQYMIFSAGATLSFSEDPKEILEESNWKIDPQRRARLLPFKYQKESVGMMNNAGTLSLRDEDVQTIVNQLGDGEVITLGQLLSDSSLSAYDTQFYIKNGGIGYTDNDKFTVEGVFGEGVELQARVDEAEGIVRGFIVNSGGFDYFVDDFADLGFEVEKIAKGGGLFGNNLEDASALRIVLQSENALAGGFEGYVLFGAITYTNHEDFKPKIASEGYDVIEISAESNTQGIIAGGQLGGNQFQAGQNFGATAGGGGFANGSIGFGEGVEGFADLSTEPGDLVYGINTKSVAIIDFSQDQSIHELYRNSILPRNRFDIFLHFQNDISHTWIDYLGSNGVESFCRNQTINLEIYPF
jgi:hypothetical protein